MEQFKLHKPMHIYQLFGEPSSYRSFKTTERNPLFHNHHFTSPYSLHKHKIREYLYSILTGSLISICNMKCGSQIEFGLTVVSCLKLML